MSGLSGIITETLAYIYRLSNVLSYFCQNNLFVSSYQTWFLCPEHVGKILLSFIPGSDLIT